MLPAIGHEPIIEFEETGCLREEAIIVCQRSSLFLEIACAESRSRHIDLRPSACPPRTVVCWRRQRGCVIRTLDTAADVLWSPTAVACLPHRFDPSALSHLYPCSWPVSQPTTLRLTRPSWWASCAGRSFTAPPNLYPPTRSPAISTVTGRPQ